MILFYIMKLIHTYKMVNFKSSWSTNKKSKFAESVTVNHVLDLVFNADSLLMTWYNKKFQDLTFEFKYKIWTVIVEKVDTSFFPCLDIFRKRKFFFLHMTLSRNSKLHNLWRAIWVMIFNRVVLALSSAQIIESK